MSKPSFWKLKNVFTFIVLVSLSGALHGQHKYIPFPDSNRVWVEKAWDEFGVQTYFYQFRIQKDTLINGLVYSKVHYVDSNLKPPTGLDEFWFGIRNDTINRKVFIVDYFSSAGIDILLYDYSLSVGDTFPLNSYYLDNRYGNSIIVKIDSVLIDGKSHLVYYPESPSKGTLKPYIEGIGSVTGLIGFPYDFEGGQELVCLLKESSREPYFTTLGNEGSCKLHKLTTNIDSKPNISNDISISPNPIVYGSAVTVNGDYKRISKYVLYKSTGETIHEVIHPNRDDLLISPFINDNGIYFIKVFIDSRIITMRIVKI